MRLFLIFAAAVTLGMPAVSVCQKIDPVTVSPGNYKVLLENQRMRVVEYTIKPGESDKPHNHPQKVSYVADGGTLRITLADTSFVSEEISGAVSYACAAPRHFATNTGSTPVRIILFEPKKIDNDAPLPGDDAFANNPSTLSVKLENSAVRVMEAIIPPAHKEKQHSHPPYAMYFLSGGTVRMHYADGTTRDVEFKRGQASFSDKVTHWAENTGTSAIRVILVELRHKN
jgi:quercetin dioxygenase-like cupin family protein